MSYSPTDTIIYDASIRPERPAGPQDGRPLLQHGLASTYLTIHTSFFSKNIHKEHPFSQKRSVV